MSFPLDEVDRRYLEEIVRRKVRPSRRQVAQILLRLAAGEEVDAVAMHVGVSTAGIRALAMQYSQCGLESTMLAPALHRGSSRSSRKNDSAIVKTPSVCGGDARVFDTRIPVWQLVEAKDMETSEAQLLIDFLLLTAKNLVDAWAYAESHPKEIAASILANAVA